MSKLSNKSILFTLLILVIILSLSACDSRQTTDRYNSEVIIEGVEVPQHHDLFKIINSSNNTRLSWEKEDAYEDGSLKGTLTDLERETRLEIIIDNESIEDNYRILEPESGSINVDSDNNNATFLVELEYEPELTEINLDGPEKIYASQRQDQINEYEYKANLYDQYHNQMDREVEWIIEDKPEGISINDNILEVAWDVEAGIITLKVNEKGNQNIYDSLEIEVDYLRDDLESDYERAFSLLDDKLADLNLMEIKDELMLPENIVSEELDYDYEIIWTSENEAIEIVNNQPVIQEITENTEGVLQAFIQPLEDVYQTQEVDGRKNEYQTKVLAPSRANISISLQHNFPSSKVDDFFSLQSDGTYSLKVKERERVSSLHTEDIKEVIVKLTDRVRLQSQADTLSNKGYEIVKRNSAMNSLLVEIPEGRNVKDFKNEIAVLSGIEYVIENSRVSLLSVNHPDDEDYPYQWHYSQIRLPQAWDIETGSNHINISVLDTGVDTGHPDIGDNIDEEAGYNFVDDNFDFTDYHGHGTHVAGTIAANNDAEGVSGVNWNSNIIPLKVLGDDGSGGVYAIADAILYSAGIAGEYTREPLNEPVDIINMSLGTGQYNSYFEEAVDKARAEGVLIIAAAGNDGEETLIYPAAFENVISVGAVDFNYPDEPQLAPYSNYSEELDIFAPGGNLNVDTDQDGYYDGVLSTGIYEGSYEYLFMQGTSMAAPHVSGVVGLMLSHGISSSEVRSIIKSTSMSLSSYQYDAGLINVYWAINQVKDIKVTLYKDGYEVEKVDEKIISLEDKYLDFKIPEAGQYKLEAVIDVRKTGKVDPGDYFKNVFFEVEEAYEEKVDIKMELEEVKSENVLDG